MFSQPFIDGLGSVSDETIPNDNDMTSDVLKKLIQKLYGSIPDRYFTLYTGDILYTFSNPKGSSTGSTLEPRSSK